MWRGVGATIVMLCGAAAAAAAAAPALPYHVDADARETLPTPGAVTTLRFLTSTGFPPFNYRDAKGELVGFNIDLARAICADLAVVCTIQAWAWEQLGAALVEGQGDAAVAGIAVNEASARTFDFSLPYLAFPARFVTRAADVAAFEPLQLAGKRLALRAGTAHADFVRRHLPEVTLLDFPTEFAALEAVRDGAADAYFGDAMRASFWLATAECCAFAGAPYFQPDRFGEGLAVAVPIGRGGLRGAIDTSLVRLKRNGTLDELYLRWFPIGFY